MKERILTQGEAWKGVDIDINAEYRLTYNVVEQTWDNKLDTGLGSGHGATSQSISRRAVVITGYSGNANLVDIPRVVTGLPVVAIEERAFERAGFKRVIIPETVEEIGDSAFFNCEELAEITVLGSRILNIEDNAFARCKSLATVDFPHKSRQGTGTLIIHEGAFSECEMLTHVTFPYATVKLYAYAFEDCTALWNVVFLSKSIRFGGKDGAIDGTEFMNCPLKSVRVSEPCISTKPNLIKSMEKAFGVDVRKALLINEQ